MILLNIINDILDFAEMERGKFKFNFESFSISDLMK